MLCNCFIVVTVLCLRLLLNVAENVENEGGGTILRKTFQHGIKENILKPISTTIASVITYSPEWIHYQKERFNIDDGLKKNNNLNKIIEENEGNLSKVENNVFEKMLADENSKEKTHVLLDFMKFLKSLSLNIWSYSNIDHLNHRVKLLNTFSGNLLKIIERQFSILWLNNDEMKIVRRKRGILHETTVNYLPEASLISICFLTFSVFLIKLVLQVVNIIKSRHYTFNGNDMTNVNVA